MTDLFDQNNLPQDDIDPTKNYYEELVGEGKKFSDNEALAKSIVHKDSFIERLKAEQAGLRQELNTRVKMEEFIDKMNTLSQVKSPSNGQDSPGRTTEDNPKGLTDEDLNKLLDTKLSEREKQLKATLNVEQVKQKLQEALGPQYATKLEQMTNTLGLSREYLNSIASTSPAAFLKLVGIEEKKSRDDIFTPPPRSQVNPDTQVSFNSGSRNVKYYENLFNNDPEKYWSPKVQNEMHADRKKLGARFYN
jgi:hypothetical protein